MHGLMQDWPLLMHTVLDHAAIQHPKREVVSRSVEGPFHRTDYATVRARALKVAQRLEREGIAQGDRVATLAWNTWRHLEAWYGISGIGAVGAHGEPAPVSRADRLDHQPRRQDRILMLDLSFVPLVQGLAERLSHVERFVILTDAAHMPETSLRNAVAYEDWIAEADGDFAWARLDENAAAGLCYTSGTTGDPKGVVYSHRSNVIHAMVCNQADCFGLAAADRVMPVVPMFHANGWALALCAPMVGAGAGDARREAGRRLGARGASTQERVTFSAAVPTVWMMLLQHLEATGGASIACSAWRSAAPPARAAITKAYRGEIRRARHPCLGHDRDLARRHAVRGEAGGGASARRGEAGACRRSRARRPTPSR